MSSTRNMWGRRLLWFVGLWAASILALGVVALILRTTIKAL